MVLDTMLAVIKTTTTDRVVLISNYTQTLELFERLAQLRNYSFARLDGSMTAKKRAKVSIINYGYIHIKYGKINVFILILHRLWMLLIAQLVVHFCLC